MKYKIIQYALLTLAAALAATACQQSQVEKFDDSASLYFYRDQYTANSRGVMQYDSIDYSFFLAGSARQAELWLQVELTGRVTPHDRAISVVQQNAGQPGAAVAGTHYVSFDDPRVAPHMVMPAGATSTLIPVLLTRTEAMDNATFRLVLQLAPNGDFTEGIKQGYNGQPSFVVNITAQAIKPLTWDRNYDYAFGAWGQEKMRFLIDEVGFDNFDLPMDNLDLRYFWNLKAKNTLSQYEAANGPLYEADQITRVTFP